MFTVKEPIERRHAYIAQFLDDEHAPLAILLAAADFERCVRRAVLGLGTSPTKQIRAEVLTNQFSGLDRFKAGWRAEVKPRVGLNLANDVVKRWDRFARAYRYRHRLIHGVPSKLSAEFASDLARTILVGAEDVNRVAQEHGVELDRTIRRYKRWEP